MTVSSYLKRVPQRYLAYPTYPKRRYHEDFVFFSLTHEPEGDSSHYDGASLSLSPSLETFSSFLCVFFVLAWLLFLLLLVFLIVPSAEKAHCLLSAENMNAYFGAIVQISLRPVCWGGDSTLPISSSCSMTCRMILCPSSI